MAKKIKKVVLEPDQKKFFGDNIAENIIGNKLKNTIDGGGGDDIITGGLGNDKLFGGDDDDRIISGLGKDKVDGGSGIDTLFLKGNFEDAIITEQSNGSVVIRLGKGTTTASNIEFFEFSDRTLSDEDLVNDAPTGSATAVIAGTEDVEFVVTAAQLLQGFSDPNGDTISVSGLSATNGSVVDNGDGTFTVKPTKDFNGTLTLSYQVTDGDKSTSATKNITIAAANDAPTGEATATFASKSEDVPFDISAADLLAGFTDIDGDTLSVSNLTVDHGTVVNNNDGTFTITPDVNFFGTLTLSYEVTDGSLSVDATNTVEIVAVNDNPVLVSGLSDANAGEGNDFSYVVPAGAFSDPDGDSLTLTATLANGSPLPSWLTFNAGTRTFSGNPPDGTAGTISIKVIAKDPSGLEASDTFDIAIADTFKDLTTGADALSLTNLSETINGNSSTYQVDDSIIDSTTTDNDTLNLTLIAASPQAVVRGVENINVNWNALNFADFDAKFISGATITFTSTKVGYAGDVVVRNAGANKIVAGEGAKSELVVYGGTTVTVDAGAADKVAVQSSGVAANDLSAHVTAGAGTALVFVEGFKTTTIVGSAATTEILVEGQSTLTDTANISVVGNVTIEQALVENLNLTAAANSEIELLSQLGLISNSITSTGAVTLIADLSEIDGLQLTNSANGLTIDLNNDGFGGTADLSNIQYNLLNITNALTDDLIVASGANIRADVDLNPGMGVFQGYRIFGTNSNVDSATLTLTVDQTDIEVYSTSIGLEQLHIVSALAASDAGGVLDIGCINGHDVEVVGADNLHVAFASVDSLDASQVTGSVVIDEVDDFQHLVTSILGSATAENTVTFNNVSNKVAYTGGADIDTVNAMFNQDGIVTADLKGGDNIFNGTVDSGVVSVTSGDGKDLITIETNDAGGFFGSSTVTVVSGGGDDDVSIAMNDVEALTLNVNLGAGEDAFSFDSTSTIDGSEITIDGGADIDTIDLGSSDLSLGKVTITNVEQLNDSSGAAIVSGALLHNATFTLLGRGVDGEQLDVVLGTTNGIYDFSKLTIDSSAWGLRIYGSSVDDTVTGTSGKDYFDLGDGTNVFKGGADEDIMIAGNGSDRFVFTDVDADKDTTLFSVTDQIYLFDTTADTLDFTTAGSATNYLESTAAGIDSAAAAEIDLLLDGTVKYVAVQDTNGGGVYLFQDDDGKGFTNVVYLDGLTLADIEFADIV